MEYDVIVVGGGFAGLSAALFTGGWGLKTLVLEAENHPSLWSYPRRKFLETMSGTEIVQRMVEEAKRDGTDIHTGERAVDLDMEEKKIVKTQKEHYTCDALVLATGPRWKFLNVPGETWLARGTSYCAECHGRFFKDSDVTVVGSGDAAAHEALLLSQIARGVTLVTNSKKLEAKDSLSEELARKGIQVVKGYKVEAIERRELTNIVRLVKMETGETRNLATDGIFIALGIEPTALKVEKIGVRTHRQGNILVDGWQQTNVEGVFAAGDCTCSSGFNLTSCLGDGVKAGLAAYLYLKRLRKRK